MNQSCSQLIRFLFVFCCLLCLPRGEMARAEVSVQTNDGRVLVGEVDVDTDDKLLWIRQQNEQIALSTSIAWSEIASATVDGEVLPLAELPTLLQLKTEGEPLAFVVKQATHFAPSDCKGDCLPVSLNQKRNRARKPRVRSLAVDAFLVNLDRDVEPDGLELAIAALDEHGVPVDVKGNLYVKLWGERIQPHGSLVEYEDLQRWNQPVATIDFVDGVANYALRFRTVRPAFDVGLHSEALVNVSLGVAGQGNFTASVPVQIRAFNPFRDRLQQTTGSRFLPNELTNEVRHIGPHRTHTRELMTRQSRNR